KGAFANVLEICTTLAGDGATRPLDAVGRAALEEYFRRKGEEGFRVLALAVRRLPARAHYAREDECDMTFTGFLLFQDPAKPTAAATIRALAALGIRTK